MCFSPSVFVRGAWQGLRGSETTANVKGRIIYVFHFSESRPHPHQRQVLRAARPQMPGAAGGGRDHRGPRHRALSAESRAAQRLHRHFRRDRRRAADVHHRPRHQPSGADAGRPHRHPHRLRGRGGASGWRHPALQPVLWLFGAGQPGVLSGALHRHHHDGHQRLHHRGHPAGAGQAQELPRHHHRQRSRH